MTHLGGGVYRQVRNIGTGGDGGHVHNGTLLLLEHGWEDHLHHGCHGPHVNVNMSLQAINITRFYMDEVLDPHYELKSK